VVRYVRILLQGGPSHTPVDQKDIGIIAPYIRQVYKLKAKLKDKGWEDIEVGTTETYQGREKRVILISTVRSQRNLLAIDSKFKLGFVANAKVCCSFSNIYHLTVFCFPLFNSLVLQVVKHFGRFYFINQL